MSRKPTLGWSSLSVGAYVLFRRIPEGLNALGFLMFLLQALLIFAAFTV